MKENADVVIKTANKIADKNVNQKPHYHEYKRELPEQLILDHYRYINDRILKAEEAKIKMECTAELIDGLYRRFLPSTVGRRNGLIEPDLQDAYYSDQYDSYFNRARDILTNNFERNTEELDSLY